MHYSAEDVAQHHHKDSVDHYRLGSEGIDSGHGSKERLVTFLLKGRRLTMQR
jgi:hypothetical protein